MPGACADHGFFPERAKMLRARNIFFNTRCVCGSRLKRTWSCNSNRSDFHCARAMPISPFLACNGAVSILVRAAKPLDFNLPFARAKHVATDFEKSAFFIRRERARQNKRFACSHFVMETESCNNPPPINLSSLVQLALSLFFF